MQEYKDFVSFYPFYLSEHANRLNRRLHVVGTACVLLLLCFAVLTGRWTWLWLLPVVGYGFAWIGHFLVEKNRPATFKYPLYSLWGDFVMFKDVITGRIPW